MSMNVGTGGSEKEPEVMIDINTTPLIDVMLVLLVMLIITIPIQLHSVNLNMPIGTPPPPLEEPVVITVDVDFDGTIYWNGEILANKAALEERLTAAAATPVQPEVHIRGDLAGRYEFVGRVVFAAQRAGIQKIGFVTEPPPRT